MKKLHKIVALLNQKMSRLLILVIILGLAVTLLFYLFHWFQFQLLKNTRDQLMKHPEPVPSYILGLAPFPGTKYPQDPYSHVYWTSAPAMNEIICVALDAHAIVSGLTNSGKEAFDVVQMSQVDLYLNNESVITPENLQQDKDGLFQSPKIKRQGFREVGTTTLPIHFCWDLKLSPGPYLAELTVQSEISGTLRYQWAFEVAED